MTKDVEGGLGVFRFLPGGAMMSEHSVAPEASFPSPSIFRPCALPAMTDRDSRNGIIRSTPRQPAPRGVKPGLTALGTAAVLGIYAAGFTLTEDVAHGLDGVRPDGLRETALADVQGEVGPPLDPGAGAILPVTAETAQLDGGSEPGQAVASGVQGSTSSLAPVQATPVASPGSSPSGESATTAPPPSPSVSTSPSGGAAWVPPGPGVAAAPAQASAGLTSPAPSPTPVSAPANASAAAPAAETTSAEPAPESPYLDGLYTARGIRTGHGDIEATVEIVSGRIESIVVSNCRMRWPCTDVNPMIPRMIRAQRAGVPIITGATQSSDSFSTAVDQALALARAAKLDQTSPQ